MSTRQNNFLYTCVRAIVGTYIHHIHQTLEAVSLHSIPMVNERFRSFTFIHHIHQGRF